MRKFNELKKEMLSANPELAKEYHNLAPRYEAISQIIDARLKQNITQEELAKRIGTQKSNISRFESGNYNPSLDFLTKVVHALGLELHINIK